MRLRPQSSNHLTPHLKEIVSSLASKSTASTKTLDCIQIWKKENLTRRFRIEHWENMTTRFQSFIQELVAQAKLSPPPIWTPKQKLLLVEELLANRIKSTIMARWKRTWICILLIRDRKTPTSQHTRNAILCRLLRRGIIWGSLSIPMLELSLEVAVTSKRCL